MAMFQDGCNNLPMINQQQNVGRGGGRRREGTTRQSKSKEGVGGLGGIGKREEANQCEKKKTIKELETKSTRDKREPRKWSKQN